jgi:FkbM family methyltransferase
MLCKIGRYYSKYGFAGLLRRIRDKFTSSGNLMKFSRNELSVPFFLRAGTSDIGIYEQVFFDQEYDFSVTHPPKVILDAGANIGLASIYFANKYPEAKIIAIEPEGSNFELLKKNVEPYSNIIPVQAALWDKNESISLVDPGLDKCGFMTRKEGVKEKDLGDILAKKTDIPEFHQVPGMTVDKIMEDYNLSEVDILKIDIEGAEKEVFKDTSAWIGNVNSIIVELHERMKLGCNRSFYNGSNGFDNEWSQGENVYLSKLGYLIQHNI